MVAKVAAEDLAVAVVSKSRIACKLSRFLESTIILLLRISKHFMILLEEFGSRMYVFKNDLLGMNLTLVCVV